MLGRQLAAATAAGIVLLGGCASGAATAPATSAAAAGSRTAGGGTTSGAVRLTGYSNSDGPRSTAILTGAIGDYGTAVSVHPDGTVDPQHSSQLRLGLTRGSFRIVIGPLDKQLVSAFRRFPPDRVTCSGIVTVTGAAPVVADSGTGAYRGISGSFRLTIMIAEVDARRDCSPSSAFLSQAVIMAGRGTVSFG
jgi:hypothetical protein